MTLATVTLQIPCGACSQAVTIEIVEPRIINAPEVSVITIVHDRVVECPHCRVSLGIILAGIQDGGYVFRTVPVQKPQDRPRIVVPGNGFRG